MSTTTVILLYRLMNFHSYTKVNRDICLFSCEKNLKPKKGPYNYNPERVIVSLIKF